jgi:hypothetical protein
MERRSIAKLAAQVGGIKLPAHVSIKGNVFALVDDAGNRVHVGTTLDCVILDMNEKMSRLFWGVDAQYDEDNQSPPLCFSDNGIAPSARALEPQAKTCMPDREGITGCRWSVWGSGKSKKTGEGIPACQNGVKLALMIVKEQKKEWVPAIGKAPGAVFFFRVPPASLGAIASYGKTVAGMGKLTLPWTGEEVSADTNYMITRITFRGTGVVQFQAVGYITEQIDGVIEEISQTKVDASIGRDDEPIAAALPAPEEKPVTTLENSRGTGAPALPQPTPAVAAPKKPRGRPPKNGNAPAASAAPFEPKPDPRFVTGQDVRDHAAQQQQEFEEAKAFEREQNKAKNSLGQQENPAFGIVESAPEPPADVLDQFMQLDLK